MTLIVAHRGASAQARENTLEAFQRAIELGADMIELDVRKTSDGYMIVYHDDKINGRFVSSLTYGELSACSGELAIPTLEQVLLIAKQRINLDIELKEGGYEEHILNLVFKHYGRSGFIITSFNDESLMSVKKICPSVPTGLILGIDKPKNLLFTRISELFPMKRCLKIRADILIPHYSLLRFGFLRRAKKNHKLVMVWTVNDRSKLFNLLKNDEIHGIITNIPDQALRIRDEIHYSKISEIN